MSYDFHLGNHDNGNVYQIINGRDNNRTQNFTYDALNRIQQAWTSGANWGERFTIDPWGNLYNRTFVTGKTNYESLVCQPTILNQLATCGINNDAAGNIISNGSASYTYDAESHLQTTAGVTYTYDGDGNRVKKSNGALYWGSGPLAETGLSGNIQQEYVYFNGKRVARRDRTSNSPKYYFSDHLGSASVVTDSVGTMSPLEESDYYPYGGEIAISGSNINKYKFTGKERDNESGLDNFGARYDVSSLGRFMTPDPLMASAHARDPQTWNRYAYTLNNPVRFIDPDGMEVPSECAKDPKCKIVVNLNVIYDKSVQWSNKDKKTIEAKFLDKAKKDFGTSNIELKTTYSEGTFTRDDQGYHLTGLKNDSLNVYFSNGSGTGHPGVSFATPSGDVTIVDASHPELLYKNWLFPVGTNTFEHELAHQFLGHPYLPQGSKETETDWNVYKQGVWGSPNQQFRLGLEPRSYATPANPEAIKPKQ